jgi:hypothetical protein
MSLPGDFNAKTTVTIGLLIWIAGVSFSMGMIYKSIMDNEKEHLQIKMFIEQEVGGLRADWERDRAMKENEIEDLNQKVFGK